eukprot:scaffold1307_cov200-Pinguiococcus_pyrenoidosus.AAC.73
MGQSLLGSHPPGRVEIQALLQEVLEMNELGLQLLCHLGRSRDGARFEYERERAALVEMVLTEVGSRQNALGDLPTKVHDTAEEGVVVPPREQELSREHLRQGHCCGPDVHGCALGTVAQHDFRSAVVPADHIRRAV